MNSRAHVCSHRTPVSLLAVAALVFATGGAAVDADAQEPGCRQVPPAARPPLLDGRDQDRVWTSKASLLGRFLAVRPGGERFESMGTSARAACDGSNLYLFLDCGFSRARLAATRVTLDTPMARVEHVELLFGAWPWLRSRLRVDLAGRVVLERLRDGAWRREDASGLTIKVRCLEDGWSVELGLPRALLFARGVEPGARLALRITRRGGEVPVEELDLGKEQCLLLGTARREAGSLPAPADMDAAGDPLARALRGLVRRAPRSTAGRLARRALRVLGRKPDEAGKLVAQTVAAARRPPAAAWLEDLAAVERVEAAALVPGWLRELERDRRLPAAAEILGRLQALEVGVPYVPLGGRTPAAQSRLLLLAARLEPVRASERRATLVPLLRAWLRGRDRLVRELWQNQGATACAPGICLRLAIAQRLLAFAALPASTWAKLGGLQLAAHTNPDGSGAPPGGAELASLRVFAALRGNVDTRPRPRRKRAVVTPSPLPGPGMVAARRLFSYLAARVMADARLPLPGTRSADPVEESLARWGMRLFPDEPAFQRFLPEGLVAAPVLRSAPALSHASEYGGIYLMRAPTLECAVSTPAGARGRVDPGAFAVLRVVDRDAVYLSGPGVLERPAALLVDDRGPDPDSLPRAGSPLPYRWVTTPDWDFLRVRWRVRPDPAKAPVEVQRMVLLARTGAPYLLVADAAGREARLVQNLVRGPAPGLLLASPGRARLLPLHAGAKAAAGHKPEADAAKAVVRRLLRVEHGRCLLAPLVFVKSQAGRDMQGESTPPAPGVRFLRRGRSGLLIEVERGRARRDYLLLAPPGEGSGRVGGRGVEAAMRGAFACVRLGNMGLERLLGIGLRRLDFTRGACWRLGLSEPADVYLRVRDDGTWSVCLQGRPRRPVSLRVRVQAKGKAKPLTATVMLRPGRFVAFGLL